MHGFANLCISKHKNTCTSKHENPKVSKAVATLLLINHSATQLLLLIMNQDFAGKEYSVHTCKP